MSIYPQGLLDTHDELIVDGFSGGGGTSIGIEMGLGRSADIAINHDDDATAMHSANHPNTQHHVCDIFEVDPRIATGGRKVGFLWISPDCTDHSKAKGDKPMRSGSIKRRALAHVGLWWTGTVKPRGMILENVEEFEDWTRLVAKRDPASGRVLKADNTVAAKDNAQGFPPNYIIDRGADGRKLTKTAQVRMAGNSVCPPLAAAIVRANFPEMIARKELRSA